MEVELSVDDLIEGRAHIEWPLEAALNLCHWAGAPWADRNPDAYLHPLQVEVLGHRERELIVHGASRLGKSVLGGCEILIALHTMGTNCGVFAHRWSHVGHEFQYAHRGIRKLYGHHPSAIPRNMFRNQGNNQNYEIETVWNAKARGFSTGADDGAAALGQEFTQIVMGEGSRIKRSIRETMLQRAIDGALMNQRYPREDIGRIFIFTTPAGYEGCAAYRVDQIRRDYSNDVHACTYGKVPWVSTCWVREANILENPAYDRRAFDAAKKNLDWAAFEEQYLGKMVFKSGRVYAGFQEGSHVVDPPSPELVRDMRFAIGIDTGAYFGAVLLGLDRNNVLWMLGEVYTEKRDIDYSCDKIRERFLAILQSYLPSVADWETAAKRIKYCFVDPASQHKQEIKHRLGMTVRIPFRHDGEFHVLPTIDQLRFKIQQGEMYALRTCTYFLDQMRKYVWKETKTPGSKEPVIREPRKDYDHLMDAFRFGGVPLIEMGPYVEPPPAMTLAEAQALQWQDMVFGDLKRKMASGERNPESEVW